MNLFLAILTIGVLIMSCSAGSCDDGYTKVDNFCIPDYVVGIKQNFERGNTFYHSEFGIITFKNNKWYDQNNLEIKNIDN